MRYKHLIFGGTFDHLHRGHRALIDRAFAIAEEVSLGITTKTLLNNKPFRETIEPYAMRKQAVTAYLRAKGFSRRAKIIPIADIYGTSLTDTTIEAILVTELTYKNTRLIQTMRKEKRLPAVEIVKVPLVMAQDGGIISSERIRGGEINREGENYQLLISNFQKGVLHLPAHLREELRRPLGKIIRGSETELDKTVRKVVAFIRQHKPVMTIAVGDIIARSLQDIGFHPDVRIIDYRSRRKLIHPKDAIGTKSFVNRPGTISKEAVDAIYKTIHLRGVSKTSSIVIDGEEDLLALPAILFVPLHALVLHGQIDLGVVAVEVTEERKQRVAGILNRFT